MMTDEFKVYKNMDSFGNDIYKSNITDIDTLKEICMKDPRCIGFNSLGYLKFYVSDSLKVCPNINLYVNSKRLEEFKNKKIENSEILEGYTCYQFKDSHGYDLYHKPELSLVEMKQIADSDPNCLAFNNQGYFKNDLNLESCFKQYFGNLYVKNIPFAEIKTRIKCINLEKRLDRKNNMIKLLENVNLLEYCDFFKAVDGKLLEKTEEVIKLFKGNIFGSRKTVIGCALSHYYLWKELANDKNYDNYLILEDDIKFNSNNPSLNIIKTVKTKNDFDIIYFGYHINKNYEDAYNKIYGNPDKLTIIPHLQNISIGGTFGYLISKKGVNKLLSIIDKYEIKYVIDNMAYNYEKEANIIQYETVPRIILSDYVSPQNFGQIDSDIHYCHDKFVF